MTFPKWKHVAHLDTQILLSKYRFVLTDTTFVPLLYCHNTTDCHI